MQTVFKRIARRLPFVGVRTKVIVALMVVVLFPILIGVLSLRVLGHRYYRAQQGVLFQVMAEDLCASIEQGLIARIDSLSNWLVLSGIQAELARLNAERPTPAAAELALEVSSIEDLWPVWSTEEPLVAAILNNDIAARIKDFQLLNPLFAEVFVTDREGRVAAASNKTTDYWQADETWWQQAASITDRRAWVEGIHFDRSAGVSSLDVALPVGGERAAAGGDVLGVLKAVIDASPLLHALAPEQRGLRYFCDVVLADGRVLATLSSGDPGAPPAVSPGRKAAGRLSVSPAGWLLLEPEDGRRVLAGHAPLKLSAAFDHPRLVSDITPMHVIVYDDLDVVLAPVRIQIQQATLWSLLAVVTLGIAGYLIVSRHLVVPLVQLRRTAQAIASLARRGLAIDRPDTSTAERRAEDLVEEVAEIETGDEIQELARDFAFMSRRVLHYHRQMKQELTAKTEAIQQDLAMAREFHEAFLPRECPLIPPPPHRGRIRLHFGHVYESALSVGGDFFDINPLDTHRVSVFVADVMGHGARAALITAILRPLLRTVPPDARDAGELLARMNTEVLSLGRRTDAPLFVTAIHCIVDTREARAYVSVGGHPLPLLARHTEKTVSPLLSVDCSDPAVGLFPTARYRTHTAPLKPGMSLVFYTDGVTEAARPDGTEFGVDRLETAVCRALDGKAEDIPRAVLESVDRFMDTAVAQDDICLVSMTAAAP